MTDEPARWPPWRPPTEYPRLGVDVLVTVRDETGSEWIDFGERLPGGQWRIGDQIAMENDALDVVAWMPVPPPADPTPQLDALSAELEALGLVTQPGSIVRRWCGTEGCLMPGEHLESECHTLAMMEAAEEAEARETVKAKSYPTKEVNNQASDPKGKT